MLGDNNNSCEPFIFDENGNLIENGLNSRLKDNQLLGYAMDGLGQDNEKMVVCAPQMKSQMTTSGKKDYYLHGICYWTSNTNVTKPEPIIITALKERNLQSKMVGDKNVYFYWLGEMGFSVHVNDANDEILMGAPGINNWKGSLVHFKQNNEKEVNTGTGEVGPSTDQNRLTEVDASGIIELDEDSYLGYAVSTGYFLKNSRKTLYYVSSAPQAGSQSGRVFIFSIIEDKIKIHKKFDSQQMGEYFGYSILVEDFNNDDLPDIAIGAPLYSKTGFEDNGAVYVYKNNDKWSFFEYARITIENDVTGRFGTSLGKIGDINLDGFNDLAVGAPFEGDGAVYIYLGSSSGLKTTPSQKIVPIKRDIKSNNFMFGHTISRGVDIDQNEYNDVAIGAPEAERVFLYRTYPVGKISSTLKVDKQELKEDDRNLKVIGCWRIQSVTPVNEDLGKLKLQYLHDKTSFYRIIFRNDSDS